MPIIVREPPKKPPKPKANACQYFWREDDGKYFFDILGRAAVSIVKRHGRWIAEGKLKEEVYFSAESLEAAFKLLDREFYVCYPDLWVKSDAQAVMAPWKGDLNL